MTFPVSWTDSRLLVPLSGVLAVAGLAAVLRWSDRFTPFLFGVGVLGVAVIATAALVLRARLD